MQGVHLRVALPFGQVELRVHKGLVVGRVRQTGLHIRVCEVRELGQKGSAALARELGQLSGDVGKKALSGSAAGLYNPIRLGEPL